MEAEDRDGEPRVSAHLAASSIGVTVFDECIYEAEARARSHASAHRGHWAASEMTKRTTIRSPSSPHDHCWVVALSTSTP